MFYLTKQAKVFLYNKPVNLHKGFDSLAHIVRTELGFDLAPDIYVLFCNLRRDRIKVLYLDKSNLALMSMRFGQTLDFKYNEIIQFDRNSFEKFLNKTISRRLINRYKLTEN